MPGFHEGTRSEKISSISPRDSDSVEGVRGSGAGTSSAHAGTAANVRLKAMRRAGMRHAFRFITGFPDFR